VSALEHSDDAPAPRRMRPLTTQRKLQLMNREAERCTVLVKPLLPLGAHRVWHMDSWVLPIPANVLPYVRDGVTWRMAIHTAVGTFIGGTDRVAIRELRRTGSLYQTFIRSLMYLGPDSEAVGRLMLELFPPVRCAGPHCEREFLPYSKRVTHCSDQCRRNSERAKEAAQREASMA